MRIRNTDLDSSLVFFKNQILKIIFFKTEAEKRNKKFFFQEADAEKFTCFYQRTHRLSENFTEPKLKFRRGKLKEYFVDKEC